MKRMSIGIDENGNETFSIPFSDCIYHINLSANMPKTVTVPNEARFANFSATGLFYAREGAVSVPDGDVTDGSAGDLNPATRSVTPGTEIGLVAPNDCVVVISFYK